MNGFVWAFKRVPIRQQFRLLPMDISVKPDVKQLTKKLNAIQRRQLPFATSKAPNSLSFQVKDIVTKSLPQFLHNPTPYLGKGFQIEQSNKQKLLAQFVFRSRTFGKGKGSVFQSEIMHRLFGGGTRKPKGRAIAVLFPKNRKPNIAGNLPRGLVAKLLADKGKHFSGIPFGPHRRCRDMEEVG